MSIGGTCSTCKWWQEHSAGSEGFCRQDWNLDHISRIMTRQEVTGELPSLWSKHDEVRTRPNFGCNQHKRGTPIPRRRDEDEDEEFA